MSAKKEDDTLFQKRQELNQVPLILASFALIAATSPQARNGAIKAYQGFQNLLDSLRTEKNQKTPLAIRTSPVHVHPEIINVMNDETILHMVDEIEESLH
jgi:hypothetical protein